MGLIERVLGDKYDEADDAIGAPIAEEADDLELHVRRCAQRYRQLRKDSHGLKAQSRLNGIVATTALVILALSQGDKAWKVFLALL